MQEDVPSEELFDQDMLEVIKHQLTIFQKTLDDIDQKCNNVLGDNADMKHIVDSLETRLQNARNEVKDVDQLIGANNSRLKELDFKFQKFQMAKDEQIASIIKKQQFVEQLDGKVKKLESEKASNVSLKRIEDRLWFETPSQEKFEKTIEEMNKKIDEDIDTFTSFAKKMERFRLDQNRQNDRNVLALKDSENKIFSCTNKVDSLEQLCKEIETEQYNLHLKLKETDTKFELKQDSDDLRERFNKFSEIEHIDQLQNVFLPKIAAFTLKIDEITDSNVMMTECVRKFDEDISLKASKSALYQLKENIDQNFLHFDYQHKITDQITEIKNLFDQADQLMQEKFKTFSDGFDDVIEQACEQELNRKLSEYEKVAKSFKQFFNQEDMAALIDRKADLELVRRLQDSKATRQEVQCVQSLVDNLNIKLKHITVLQMELASSILPQKHTGSFKTEEDIKNSIKQREKLSKQAQLICNWIYKEPVENSQMSGSSTRKRFNINLINSQDESHEFLHQSSFYSPRESVGREQGLLSGSTTNRREATIKTLRGEFQQQQSIHSSILENIGQYVPNQVTEFEKEYLKKQKHILTHRPKNSEKFTAVQEFVKVEEHTTRPSTFHAPFRPGKIILSGRNFNKLGQSSLQKSQKELSNEKVEQLIRQSPTRVVNNMSGQITLESNKSIAKMKQKSRIGLAKVLAQNDIHVKNLAFEQ